MEYSNIKQRVIDSCIDMLILRKYEITDIDTNLDTLIGINSKSEYIIVFTTLLEKFNTESLIKFVSYMREVDIKKGIAIYVEGVTPKANSDLLLLQDELTLELFCYKEILVNPILHDLQPVFEKLSDKEARKIKETFGTKFPIMKKTDVISRYLGYNRGDIIKVTRKDGTISYRIVKGVDTYRNINIFGGIIGMGEYPNFINNELDEDKIHALLSPFLKKKEITELIKSVELNEFITDKNEVLYQIITDLTSGISFTELKRQLSSNQFLWEHPALETEKNTLSEQDEFIENPFELVEGVITCNCGSKKVYTYSRQVRSQDEATTTFAECLSCKAKWSYR